MCGIITRISTQLDNQKTLKAIKDLEYRGYDSYGILFYNQEENIEILHKNTGTLNLEKEEYITQIPSNIELGHTRWATHGNVTKTNAHPHFDTQKQFYVIMNGIIENHYQIKEKLEDLGHNFISQTDTELIPHLYAHYLQEEQNKNPNTQLPIPELLLNLTKKIKSELKGEFSYIVKYKNYILAHKNINPLLIGTNKNTIIICSDSNITQNNSQEYTILDDHQTFIAHIENNTLHSQYYDQTYKPITKTAHASIKEIHNSTKNSKYYLEKEILDQKFLKNTITPQNIENIQHLLNKAKHKQVIISAAGSSYYAGLHMHYTLLKLGILSNTIIASELSNYTHLIKNSLIIILSQSGETADLIYPLKELKYTNEIITITNNKNSTLDRLSKNSIYLNCGKEYAVVATKSFTAQLFISKLIQSTYHNFDLTPVLNEYQRDFEKTLTHNQPILQTITQKYKNAKSFFFIAKNKYYPLALEGALKLKETTYKHAEGFAGGELKHGTLSLIEENIPCIVIDNSPEIISNAIEIKTRGGIIIGISDEPSPVFDYHLKIPQNFKETFATILMQQLALQITLSLNLNPDKPRNLAKSVTVK